MIDWSELGLQLMTARKRMGLTQPAVAELIGTHWQTVGAIERGAGARVRAGLVVAYAAAVGHPLAGALPVVTEAA